MITRLLMLANAGRYPEKNEWFYPFKDRFLRRWAVSDGYDKQIIQKVCFRCSGSGAYVSPCSACRYEGGCWNCHWSADNESFDEYDSKSTGRCPRCSGSGYYVNKTIWLERWKFGGRIFHIPAPTLHLPVLIHPPVVTYTGVIRHAAVDGRHAWHAALVLFAVFEPMTLVRLCWMSCRNFIVQIVNQLRCWWQDRKIGPMPF